MGGFSGLHILILVIIAIVLFAPKRIGQAGQSFGEAIRGFKKGLNGDEIDVTPKPAPENLKASAADPLTEEQRRERAKNRSDS